LIEDVAFRVLAAGNEPDFRTILRYGVRSGEPVAGATRFGARVTRFVSRK